MIEHTGSNIGSFEASREFYAAAPAPLEYELLHEFDAFVPGLGSVASFGEAEKPDFWSLKMRRIRRGFTLPSAPILVAAACLRVDPL
jgi:hypothetical protein